MKNLFKILVYIFAIIGFALTLGYFAVKFGWTNTEGKIDRQNELFHQGATDATSTKPAQDLSWTKTEEWKTLKAAVSKDTAVLEKVAAETGIDRRLVVAQLVAEQMRLYTSEREVYKQIFAPLKILGSQSQFSWGIMGLKQDTAIQIEKNLKDTSSEHYLGKTNENLLDFKATATDEQNSERFSRITDEHNHYYGYLYTALYLKQIMNQWKNAGHDISKRPEILSTLYNIGFQNSKPKPNPAVGGAEITINGTTYTFGSLAYHFYFSDEMTDIFPRAIIK